MINRVIFARCLETFAKNLDDAVEQIARDGARISGRSARIKRRMDMILEEIHGVQMKLARAWSFLVVSCLRDVTQTEFSLGVWKHARLLSTEGCFSEPCEPIKRSDLQSRIWNH